MEYRKPSYMRVNSQEINSVEAHVVDSVGRYVPFSLGETVMLLHFRRFDDNLPFSRLPALLPPPPPPPTTTTPQRRSALNDDDDDVADEDEIADPVVHDLTDVDVNEEDDKDGAVTDHSQRGQGISWSPLRSSTKPVKTTNRKRARSQPLVPWNAVM